MREKTKQNLRFRQRLLNYIFCTVDECMLKKVIDERDSLRIDHRVFQSLLHFDNLDFDDIMHLDVFDIVLSRQMHNHHHMITCFKYDSKRCRS